MDTLMTAFAVVGIIVAVISVGILLVWATCFFVTIAVKTFKYNLDSYSKVQKAHIEANSDAREARMARLREQKIKEKDEMLTQKIESRKRIFELKKQKEALKQKKTEAKELESLEKTKIDTGYELNKNMDCVEDKTNKENK